MIQDIGEHVFRNEFTLKREPEDGDYVLVFQGREVYIRGNGADTPLMLPQVTSFDKRRLQ